MKYNLNILRKKKKNESATIFLSVTESFPEGLVIGSMPGFMARAI